MFENTFRRLLMALRRLIRLPLSLCTGMAAELEVIEICDLPIETSPLVLCDNSPHVMEYWLQRFGKSDFYMMKDMEALRRARRLTGRCNNRDALVNVDLPPSDILFFGNPCQPFSSQQRGNILPEDHPLHDVTFVSILQTLAAQLPGIAILENVFGFNRKRKRGEYVDRSPMGAFIVEARRLRSPDGSLWFTGHIFLDIDAYDFSKVHKPRSAQ